MVTRDDLSRMRAEVVANLSATARSTERLTRMLAENAEDKERGERMLALLDAELALPPAPQDHHAKQVAYAAKCGIPATAVADF